MRIVCISEYEKIINKINEQDRSNQLIFLDSSEKFKITKHRDGKYPAIITISGFLTEDLDNRYKWQESILNAYPDREWFHLEWNTQKNPWEKREMTNKPIPYNPRLGKLKINWFKLGAGALLYYNIYTRVPYFLVNNWWHLTVRNSKYTGKLLAKTIIACDHKEFILIGHSLGARVIFNCLEHIKNSNKETNITEVHLLGGAVNSRLKKWNKTTGKVKNKIYNYYSKNDLILKRLYSLIMIDRFPIGLKAINLPYFENIDSTADISGHTEYIQNFHLLKQKNQKQLTTAVIANSEQSNKK